MRVFNPNACNPTSTPTPPPPSTLVRQTLPHANSTYAVRQKLGAVLKEIHKTIRRHDATPRQTRRRGELTLTTHTHNIHPNNLTGLLQPDPPPSLERHGGWAVWRADGKIDRLKNVAQSILRQSYYIFRLHKTPRQHFT